MATITNVIKWADNTADLQASLTKGLDSVQTMTAGTEKMIASLSGDKMLGSAANYVKAIDAIGGAEKLTAIEKAKVNDLMQKSIEKYEVLGKTAPQAMLDLEVATRKSADAQSVSFGQIATAIGVAAGAVTGIAASI